MSYVEERGLEERREDGWQLIPKGGYFYLMGGILYLVLCNLCLVGDNLYLMGGQFIFNHPVRQTDTTVLYLVISPEREGGQIHLNVVKAFDLHKLKLTDKVDFFSRNILQGAFPYIPPTTLQDCFCQCIYLLC